MRFVVIYPNREDVKQQTRALLTHAIKQGYNLSVQPIQHQLFSTRVFWPNNQELAALPFTTQVEELEFKDDNFITIRLLTMDIEVKKEEPQPEPVKAETPPAQETPQS